MTRRRIGNKVAHTAVEDAQAAGEIATRPEALTYARNWIKLYGDLEEGV